MKKKLLMLAVTLVASSTAMASVATEHTSIELNRGGGAFPIKPKATITIALPAQSLKRGGGGFPPIKPK